MKTCLNFSYPSSAATVVFGGHLNAQAAFRLDPEDSGPAIPPLRVASYVMGHINACPFQRYWLYKIII